jgi:hypothetical protein
MRRLKLRKYHYFNRFKKGIIKYKRMEKWEMEKRDEMLQELAQLGVDITVKRQYSVGYHPVSLEIKTSPEGYDLVNEFIDLELMRLAQDIPTDVLNELSASQKASNNFKTQEPKKQWSSKPKSGGFQKKQWNKPTQATSPYGQDFGSPAQWNKVKAQEDYVREALGVDPSDISNKQELADIVGKIFEYEKS